MGNKQNLIEDFFNVFFNQNSRLAVYTYGVPKDLMETEVDSDGWFKWQPVKGSLPMTKYQEFMKMFNVSLPESFINWHRAYYFLDGDCSILRLPYSSPAKPLQELEDLVDNETANNLIENKLFPFASEGNDGGYIVFDGRNSIESNEYPIRFHDFTWGIDELGPVIFSSFPKLLECLTYFLSKSNEKQIFELIPEFFSIDPTGAGKDGIDYWISWINMTKENYEELS